MLRAAQPDEHSHINVLESSWVCRGQCSRVHKYRVFKVARFIQRAHWPRRDLLANIHVVREVLHECTAFWFQAHIGASGKAGQTVASGTIPRKLDIQCPRILCIIGGGWGGVPTIRPYDQYDQYDHPCPLWGWRTQFLPGSTYGLERMKHR